MNIRPTQTGGRTLAGNTPHGDYAIELYHDHDGPVYDGDGKQVGTVRLTIKTPPAAALSPEDKAMIASRIKACGDCDQLIKFGQGAVYCKSRDCKTCPKRRYMLDMTKSESTCPLGKWSI